MAEQRKTATVQASDVEGQEELARQAYEALPPPGYQRREAMRRQSEDLERQVDALAAKALTGQLNEKQLRMEREIADRLRFLYVSNADPNYHYTWVSKNLHGNHITRAEQMGYRIVRGDEPEAAELRGDTGSHAGAGHPDSTRQLADVILMKMPMDRYLILRALDRARTVRMHEGNGTGNLQALLDRYRRHFKLHNAPQTAQYEELGGPAVQPQTFTRHPRSSPFGRRRASMERLDRHLRAGTLPGLEMQQPV